MSTSNRANLHKGCDEQPTLSAERTICRTLNVAKRLRCVPQSSGAQKSTAKSIYRQSVWPCFVCMCVWHTELCVFVCGRIRRKKHGTHGTLPKHQTRNHLPPKVAPGAKIAPDPNKHSRHTHSERNTGVRRNRNARQPGESVGMRSFI